jgi:chorismate synthase
MIAAIDEARRRQDSVGGVVECVARRVPAGLGEPVFDKLEADLAKAVLSLPASKGFEIGSGFAGTTLYGSEHNDPFYADEPSRVGSPRRRRRRAEEGFQQRQVRTRTNYSGGVQGGISNGETIQIRVAFKPTATIGKEQETVNTNREPRCRWWRRWWRWCWWTTTCDSGRWRRRRSIPPAFHPAEDSARCG